MNRIKRNKKLTAASAIVACCTALLGCGCAKNEKNAEPPKHQPQFKEVVAMGTFLDTASKAADTANHPNYKRITGEEAKKMMADNPKAIILDVRTAEEFRNGYIEKSILLPVHEIDAKAASVLTDKEATILIYCRRGNRSRTAANKLLAAGYANVCDFGGIDKWAFGLVKE